MAVLRIATILMMSHILAASLHAADSVEKYIYLRIFGAVTALPTECVFDVSTISHGASFLCESGRVIVGDYRELGPDFQQYVQENLIGKVDRCGVSMMTFGKKNSPSVLVYDKKEYHFNSFSRNIGIIHDGIVYITNHRIDVGGELNRRIGNIALGGRSG